MKHSSACSIFFFARKYLGGSIKNFSEREKHIIAGTTGIKSKAREFPCLKSLSKNKADKLAVKNSPIIFPIQHRMNILPQRSVGKFSVIILTLRGEITPMKKPNKNLTNKKKM